MPNMKYRSGERPGRNNCISSRITDHEDTAIDEIAEAEDKTRSQIVSEAIGNYLMQKRIGDKHIRILVEKGEDGVLIGSVPSIPGCHTQGETVEELIVNLKEAIEVNVEL